MALSETNGGKLRAYSNALAVRAGTDQAHGFHTLAGITAAARLLVVAADRAVEAFSGSREPRRSQQAATHSTFARFK